MAAKNTLSDAKYNQLARDVKRLFSAAESAAQAEKITVYWRIGERIASEKLERRAGYHHAVFRSLSADAGLALRSLQQAVAFHNAYPRCPSNTILSWSHYRLLCSLPAAERKRLEANAIKHTYTARQLQQAIDALQSPTPTSALVRPAEVSFIYAASLLAVVDGDTLDVDIDLGFRTWTKQRLRLAAVDTPETGTPGALAAMNFLTTTLLGARTLVLQSHATDAYGRYVAHLFKSPTAVSIDTCFKKGTHVNALLIESGHGAVAKEV